MTTFLGQAGFGGPPSPSSDTRALTQIDSRQQPFVNKDYVRNIAWLNQSVDILSGYTVMLQKGVDKANQNAIEQVQSFIADIFSAIAGLEPTGIDLGDLKYVLQGLGSLLGIDPDTPFPLNLVEAVGHFFDTFLVPLPQFTDVIFDAIIAWAELLGFNTAAIDSMQEFNDSVVSLYNSVDDTFGELGTAFRIILDNFNLGFGWLNLGSLTDLWNEAEELISNLLEGPEDLLLNVLSDLIVVLFKSLTFVTNLINPSNWLAATGLRFVGPQLAPDVADSTEVWSIGANQNTHWIWDGTEGGGSFKTAGNSSAKRVLTQIGVECTPGDEYALLGQVKWDSVPTDQDTFGLCIVFFQDTNEVSQTNVNVSAGHGASGGFSQISQTVVVPQDVNNFKIGARVSTSISSGTVWVNGISCSRYQTFGEGLANFFLSLTPMKIFQGLLDALVGGTATTIQNVIDWAADIPVLSTIVGALVEGGTTLAELTTWAGTLALDSALDIVSGVASAAQSLGNDIWDFLVGLVNGALSIMGAIPFVGSLLVEGLNDFLDNFGTLNDTAVTASDTANDAYYLASSGHITTNLIYDGSFEDAASWANAWGAQNTDHDYGTYSRKLTATGAGVATDRIVLTHDNNGDPGTVELIPGGSVFAYLRIKPHASYSSGNLYLRLHYMEGTEQTVDTLTISEASLGWGNYVEISHQFTNVVGHIDDYYLTLEIDSNVTVGHAFYVDECYMVDVTALQLGASADIDFQYHPGIDEITTSTATLTATSARTQNVTISGGSTVTLPKTNVQEGDQWRILNNTSLGVILKADNGSSALTMKSGTTAIVVAKIDAPSVPTDWAITYSGIWIDSGTKLTVQKDITLDALADAKEFTFPADSGTVATLDSSGAFTNKTYDAAGTGNVLSNVDLDNFATGIISVDDELDGAKDNVHLPTNLAVSTYVDGAVDSGGSILNTSAAWASRGAAGTQGHLLIPSDCGTIALSNGSTWVRKGIYPSSIAPTDLPTFPSTSTLGTASVAAHKDGRMFTIPSVAGDHLRVEFKTLAVATPYKVRAHLSGTAANANYLHLMLFLMATNGYYMGVGLTYDSGFYLRVAKWTSETAYSATPFQIRTYELPWGIPYWFGWRDDGTYRIAEVSYDGTNFIPILSEGRTVFMTAARCGWGGECMNGSTMLAICRSFEET